MRILLHIGQAKTGTTAIQTALSLNRQELIAQGVLYPVPSHPIGNGTNHNPLVAAISSPMSLPRWWRGTRDDPSEIIAEFADYTSGITGEIRRHDPRVVILSAESLFRPSFGGGLSLLRDWLSTMSDDITVVAYVRNPKSFYLAGVFQQLRTAGTFVGPKPIAYRSILEPYITAFGEGVKVELYDETNDRGDIVTDFFGRFVPELSTGPRWITSETRINQTPPAEVMSILQGFHELHLPRENALSEANAADFFYKLIQSISLTNSIGAKPTLHPEIARWIERSSNDVFWLRSRFGIVFPGYDYDAVGAVEPLTLPQNIRVSDICMIDRDACAKIMVTAIDQLMATQERAASAEKTQRP